MIRNASRLKSVVSQQFSSNSLLYPVLFNDNSISKRWAGHSKWANIKHTKQAKDLEKNRIFSKISHQIILAVKDGGEDPKSNYKLRTHLEEARRISMPSSTIQNAIKAAKASSLQKPFWVMYTAPSGLCVGFEVGSPNRQTAATKISQYTKKLNLKFEKKMQDFCVEKGIIICQPLQNVANPYDKAVEDAIEVGVSEVLEEDDEDGKVIIFECLPTAKDAVHKKLLDKGYVVRSSSVQLDYFKTVKVPKETVEQLEHIISKIQASYGEVVQVTNNISEEV